MCELKPCPFCNGEINKIIYEENRIYKTVCSKCKTTFTHESASQYDAEKEWNRRTEPLAEAKALSLKELKECSDIPLWIEFMRTPSRREYAQWMIIGKRHGGNPKYDYFPATSFAELINDLYIADYGIKWLAYPYEPERSDEK